MRNFDPIRNAEEECVDWDSVGRKEKGATSSESRPSSFRIPASNLTLISCPAFRIPLPHSGSGRSPAFRIQLESLPYGYHFSIDVPKLYRSPSAQIVVNPVPFRYHSDFPCAGITVNCANGANRL